MPQLMTSVRIAVSDRDVLQEMMARLGGSQGAIVHRALRLLRREMLFAGMDEGFDALRRDQTAWQEELEERNAWDETLGDVPRDG